MSERSVTPPKVPSWLSPRVIGIIAIVVTALIVLSSSFYTVDQTEEAVILRFGRILRTEGPGLHSKIPFGIEQNFNVPTQEVQKEEFGFRTISAGIETVKSSREYKDESEMLTGDLNIVNVEWIIQYFIENPEDWLFHVENRHKTIRDISQSIMNLLVGDRTILGVMGSDRSWIENEARDKMNAIFDEYLLGIRVDTVKLLDVLPPEGSVQAAFEDVNKAEQDKERLINEGKEAYNQAIPKAEGEAQRVILEADGKKLERINNAEGDVARFKAMLKEYEKYEEVTKGRLYIEMFEEVFADEVGTDLIDKNFSNFIPIKALTGQGEGGVR